MNRMLIGDVCDIVSYVLLSNITTSDILQWIYTILLIISLSIGIVSKISSAIADRKVTKEEMNEIKAAVDDAKDQLKDQIEKNDKEGK